MAGDWKQARKSLLWGALVLGIAAAGFTGFVARLPRLQDSEVQTLVSNFPPRSLSGIKELRDIVVAYGTTYPVHVGVALCTLYVIMQTFAIPGSVGIGLLTGALYGPALGFLINACVSTLGASSCYMLSWALGRPLAEALWPERLESFRGEVAQRRSHLLNYMLFLRLTPLLPNTFINVASPIVGVPLYIFAIATFLGCAPNNFMAANAGAHLGELQSMRDLYDRRMMGLLAIIAVIAIVPIFLKSPVKKTEAVAVNKAQ